MKTRSKEFRAGEGDEDLFGADCDDLLEIVGGGGDAHVASIPSAASASVPSRRSSRSALSRRAAATPPRPSVATSSVGGGRKGGRKPARPATPPQHSAAMEPPKKRSRGPQKSPTEEAREAAQRASTGSGRAQNELDVAPAAAVPRLAERSRSGSISTRSRRGEASDVACVQQTPKEALEGFADALGAAGGESSLYSLECIGRGKVRGCVPLRAIKGCGPLADTTLLSYVACLCRAHAGALAAFTSKVKDRAASRTDVMPHSPPSIDEWKVVVSAHSRSAASLPLIESLLRVCVLAANLVPGRRLASSEGVVDTGRRHLADELYSDPALVEAVLSLALAVCDAVDAVQSLPRQDVLLGGDAETLPSCFELIVRMLHDVVAFELSSAESGDADAQANLVLYALTRHHESKAPRMRDGALDGEQSDELNEPDGLLPLRLRDVMDCCFRYLAWRRKGAAPFRAVVLDMFGVLLFSQRVPSCAVLKGESPLASMFSGEMNCVVAQAAKARFFWDNIISSFAKKMKNQNTSAPMFVGTLVFHDEFVRGLIAAENTDVRDLFLDNFIVGLFASYAKSPLLASRISAPKVAEFTCCSGLPVEDAFAALFKHVVILREVLCGRDQRVKEAMLGSVECLLAQVDRLAGDGDVSAEDAEEFARAHKHGLPSPRRFVAPEADARSVDDDCSADHAAKERRARQARQRVLCFIAKLVGYCGKSFEDGTWNPEHQCVLDALVQSSGSRALGALYLRLVKLRRNLDPGITGDDESVTVEPLLTADDGNHFMFVLEAVRRRFLASCDRGLLDAGSVPEARETAPLSPSAVGRKDTSASLPRSSTLPPARRVASLAEGWECLEAQQDVLQGLQQYAAELGGELLSRFDLDYNLPAKFQKLRRNKYFSAASRPRLPSVSKCDCIAGAVSSSGVGSSSKIACANDLCQNRAIKAECDERSCPAGRHCQNQRMQRMQYARIEKRDLGAKGTGIVAAEDMVAGTLIGEYQGEVVDEDEFVRRREEYVGERHFYFMSLTPKLFIDASRYAQVTRFINHSCEPNAETQKWTAGREDRVGIFAKETIRKGEEICFDYGTKGCSGAYERPVKCLCNADKCRGFLINASDGGGDHRGLPRTSSLFASESATHLETERRAEKISDGRRLLERANVLAAALTSLTAAVGGRFDERALDDGAKQRLQRWLQRKDTAGGALGYARIPRKSPLAEKRDAWNQESSPPPDAGGPPSGKVLAPRNAAITTLRVPQPAAGVPPAAGASPAFAAAASAARPAGPSAFAAAAGVPRPAGPAAFVAAARAPRPAGRAAFVPVRQGSLRRAGGSMAPVLRNRRVDDRPALNDSDSDSSFGDYSVSSPTVPVGDDCIFVREFDAGRGACSDDEFVEAAPLPDVSGSRERATWQSGSHRSPFGCGPRGEAAPLGPADGFQRGARVCVDHQRLLPPLMNGDDVSRYNPNGSGAPLREYGDGRAREQYRSASPSTRLAASQGLYVAHPHGSYVHHSAAHGPFAAPGPLAYPQPGVLPAPRAPPRARGHAYAGEPGLAGSSFAAAAPPPQLAQSRDTHSAAGEHPALPRDQQLVPAPARLSPQPIRFHMDVAQGSGDPLSGREPDRVRGRSASRTEKRQSARSASPNRDGHGTFAATRGRRGEDPSARRKSCAARVTSHDRDHGAGREASPHAGGRPVVSKLDSSLEEIVKRNEPFHGRRNASRGRGRH
jgi:hypothetical protein